MKKLDRSSIPNWLQANYKKWGKAWEVKYNDPTKTNTFAWAQYKKRKVNRLLLPILRIQTQDHCSYCDGYPMESRIGDTIDHFRSKTQFPLLAYVWHNLFLSCSNCQQKNDFFDKRLLKPDVGGYSFAYYFLFNYTTGFIVPNPRRNQIDQKRASLTIEAFGFNDFGRPEDRLEVLEKFRDSNNPDKDKFSYRFMLL